MRNTVGVFLSLVCLTIAKNLIKGKDYCTVPIAMIRPRMMCHPLQSLWVIRKGKCVEALHCIDGYSKKECNDKCLRTKKKKIKRKTTPPTKPQTKEIPKPLTTCATTAVEFKTTTEQYEPPTGQFLTSTRETRRSRRTRRTRTSTLKEIC
ncbi:uncharacterized protein LOC122626635 [Drosophila teissieri]|uniref:uncharacterized protein LOC122626635 n=1 Tax=Drosophila teissieri TaxID=7243 RepID=UPI001CBA0111|nr:uncharacterized protein LOC122626635 [Drosophila teissieri]